MKKISEKDFIKAYEEIFVKFPLVSNKIRKILPKNKFDSYMKISEKAIKEKLEYFKEWQIKKNLRILMKYFSDYSGNLPYYIIIKSPLGEDY